MKRVQLESPFRGNNYEHTEFNIAYAHACIADCLARGEAPFASHILYTVATDDKDPIQRQFGIQAGFTFLDIVEKSVIYYDFGISKGMEYGIEEATKKGIPVEFRTLPKSKYKEFWIKNKHLYKNN